MEKISYSVDNRSKDVLAHIPNNKYFNEFEHKIDSYLVHEMLEALSLRKRN